MAKEPTAVTGGKGRPGGYSYAKMQARIDKRRLEAEARQGVHDGLTTKQKIQKATARGGSKRELERLNALLKAEKENKVEVKAATPVSPKVEKTDSTESKPRSKYKAKKQLATA